MLPCNLALIACFLALVFHKVVWLDMKGVVGQIITILLTLLENLPVKEFWKSVKIWQNYSDEFGVQFFCPPCKVNATKKNQDELHGIDFLFWNRRCGWKYLQGGPLKISPLLAYVATLPCETLRSAINDILQGGVATYLSYFEVVNNQIKKGLFLSLSVNFIKLGEYLARSTKCTRQPPRIVGIFNNHFTANLPRNLSVKSYVNWLIFDRIMAMILWPHFWPTLYIRLFLWVWWK